MLIGEIANAFSDYDMADREWKRTLDNLNKFMQQMKVAPLACVLRSIGCNSLLSLQFDYGTKTRFREYFHEQRQHCKNLQPAAVDAR